MLLLVLGEGKETIEKLLLMVRVYGCTCEDDAKCAKSAVEKVMHNHFMLTYIHLGKVLLKNDDRAKLKKSETNSKPSKSNTTLAVLL